MTIVPAVLALAGKHAWYIPRWLDRALPDLDIEGTSLRQQPAPPAAGERPGTGQHQTAGGTYRQRARHR
jgi:RND superfamily putative drug exporter